MDSHQADVTKLPVITEVDKSIGPDVPKRVDSSMDQSLPVRTEADGSTDPDVPKKIVASDMDQSLPVTTEVGGSTDSIIPKNLVVSGIDQSVYDILIDTLINNKLEVFKRYLTNKCLTEYVYGAPYYASLVTIACNQEHGNEFLKHMLKYTQPKMNKHKPELLHIACDNGYVDVVQTLVDNKVQVNRTNDLGETALMRTILSKQDKDKIYAIVKILLDNNASVDIPTCENLTPIYYAIQWQDTALMELIFKARPHLNMCVPYYSNTAMKLLEESEIYQIMYKNRFLKT